MSVISEVPGSEVRCQGHGPQRGTPRPRERVGLRDGNDLQRGTRRRDSPGAHGRPPEHRLWRPAEPGDRTHTPPTSRSEPFAKQTPVWHDLDLLRDYPSRQPRRGSPRSRATRTSGSSRRSLISVIATGGLLAGGRRDRIAARPRAVATSDSRQDIVGSRRVLPAGFRSGRKLLATELYCLCKTRPRPRVTKEDGHPLVGP
jgi:hypothetical protein